MGHLSGPADGPALAIQGLTKRYGAVTALDDVSLTVTRGTIHALVGANGSGKSTLIRVLAGVERGEPGGTIAVGPEVMAADRVSPHQAHRAGVRVVHQVPTVFPDLTVAENIGIGAGLPTRPGGSIRWRQVDRRAAEVLARLGLEVAPRTRVGDLSPARQTLVAVARAFADSDDEAAGGALLVLDEPTAALPTREVTTLLVGLQAAVDHGHTVLLVTHRLDEVARAAHDATVLRDGRHRATFAVGSIPPSEVVAMITGSAEATARPHATAVTERAFLDVQGLRAGGLGGISFRVREGEILGIAGLLGSGRSTLLEALFGARPTTEGRVGLGGTPLDLRSPTRAMAAGVALVPEQRARAVFADQSVAGNLSLAEVGRFWTGRRMDRKAERRAAVADMAEYRIVAASPDAEMTSLSGGNQQKVVLARWMRRSPRLLLLDEPTLGVDVGARAEIHEMIRRYVTGPRAALIVSSDVEELCGMADRILVLRAGRIAHEIEAGGADPDLVNQLVHEGNAA